MYKTTTFLQVFHPKNRQFSREIKVEFLDKKWRFRTVCEGIHSWRDFFFEGIFLKKIILELKLVFFHSVQFFFYYRWRDRIHCLLYTLRVNGLMISFEWFQVIFIHVSIFFHQAIEEEEEAMLETMLEPPQGPQGTFFLLISKVILHTGCPSKFWMIHFQGNVTLLRGKAHF